MQNFSGDTFLLQKNVIGNLHHMDLFLSLFQEEQSMWKLARLWISRGFLTELYIYIDSFIGKSEINGFHVCFITQHFINYSAKWPSNHNKIFYFWNYEINSSRDVLMNDFLITKTKFLWHKSGYSVQ